MSRVRATIHYADQAATESYYDTFENALLCIQDTKGWGAVLVSMHTGEARYYLKFGRRYSHVSIEEFAEAMRNIVRQRPKESSA